MASSHPSTQGDVGAGHGHLARQLPDARTQPAPATQFQMQLSVHPSVHDGPGVVVTPVQLGEG
jgi:hypothetical protein